MVLLEKDLWNHKNKLKFRKIKSDFQRQLNEDIRVIKQLNKVLHLSIKYLTFKNQIPMNNNNKKN